MEITINGVAVYVKKYSSNIRDRVEERSVASFVVSDAAETHHFVEGYPVIITDSGNTLFAGVVHTSTEKWMSPAKGLYHVVQCKDWHYLADKRLVAESYTGKTCKAIVEDIITNYLSAEGISAGTIQTGPTIKEAVLPYVRASDVLDKLAERAGFTWHINSAKKLYFVARTTTAAPFSITQHMLKHSSGITHGNPKYRNRQYLRGGKAVTTEQTETFTADGVIQTFAVGYPLAKVPTSIKEDAAVMTFGIKGIDTAKDYYWSKGDEVIVAAVAPANGVAVEIKYYGQYDILVLVENDAEVAARAAIEGAGTGYVEAIDDDTSIIDKDDAIDAAEAKLDKYSMAGKQVRFDIITYGLAPGQLVPVTTARYGLSATDLLVTEVNTVSTDIGLVYKVTAVKGPVIGGWEKFFGDLIKSKDDVRLTVGDANQILIIMAPYDENWEWSESVTETVWACPVPAVTLYPSATLYPC